MIGGGTLMKHTLGKGMFPEDDLLKTVHKHATIACLLMWLPFAGTIIYLVCLWHMYSKLNEKVGKSTSLGTVFVAICVNIFVTLIVFALEVLPIIGDIVQMLIVYVQFYLSGRTYISLLKDRW